MLTTLLFSVTAAASTKSTDCTAAQGQRLTEAQMNPGDFAAYLRDAGLKTVDDVLCCLPKSYLSNFTIVHSSASAQTSDVDRPRVMVHNDLKPKNEDPTVPLQMILTMSGGGDDLNNTENLEILFNNLRTGEGELYDADFSGAKPRVTKNPEACLRCHGDQGALPIGGPKTLLEDLDQWTHIVQGVHGCGNEIELSRAIERRVQKAFRMNPRYRCLDQAVATKDHLSGKSNSIAKGLLPFHNALAQMNARRYARYLRTTSNYESFKYLAVGTLLCTDNFGFGDAPTAARANFADWIPPRAERQMRNLSTVLEPLPTSAALGKAHATLVRSEQEMNLTQAKLGAAAKALDRGERPDFDFYQGPLSTCGEGHPMAEPRGKELKASLSGPPTLDAYKIDGALRGFRGDQFNPQFRYVFESRGIKVDGFSMDPAPQAYPAMPGALDDELMALEPPDSPLGRIAQSLKTLKEPAPGEDEEDDVRRTAVARVCGQLKRLSRSALSRIPTGARSAEPTKREATPSAH